MEFIMNTTKHQRTVYITQWIMTLFLLLFIMSPNALKSFFTAYNWAVLKWIAWWFLIAYIPEIVRKVISFYEKRDNEKTKQKYKNVILIDWILSAEDLISFIFENDWLPVKVMQKYFDINNEEYKKLWNNLERMWILKRWVANARILATRDVDYILHVLLSSSDSDKMHYSWENWEVLYTSPEYMKTA